MGKKGKYRNSRIKKLNPNENVVYVILFLLCLIFYLKIIKPLVLLIQLKLFGNSQTILLSPSLGLWSFLEITFSTVFLFTIFMLYKYKRIHNKITKFSGKPDLKNVTYINISKVTIISSFIIIVIAFISYCRIDSDRIYIRETRTLFMEKEFSWDDVKSVEINYYPNAKSGYNLQYILNLEKFSVNIQNAGMTRKDESLNQNKREIHEIVKRRNIPVIKKIVNYDNEVKDFLKLIGE